MGIRETLNRNSGLFVGVSTSVVAVLLIFIVYQVRSGGRPMLPSFPDRAFFTIDDGTTTFSDADTQEPPYDHNGKEAVRGTSLPATAAAHGGLAVPSLHMASIIIFSTLWGVALNEWKGVSNRTKGLLAAGRQRSWSLPRSSSATAIISRLPGTFTDRHPCRASGNSMPLEGFTPGRINQCKTHHDGPRRWSSSLAWCAVRRSGRNGGDASSLRRSPGPLGIDVAAPRLSWRSLRPVCAIAGRRCATR